MDDPVELACYANHNEAMMLQGMLKGYEIESRISSDDGGGVIPGQTLIRGVKVLVAREDLEKARYILEGAKDRSGATWKCDKCGEEIEGQFTECWNCGKGREIF